MSIAAQGDSTCTLFRLCKFPPEQVSQEVETQHKQGSRLIEVYRLDEQKERSCIAQGYETTQTVTTQVDGETQYMKA